MTRDNFNDSIEAEHKNGQTWVTKICDSFRMIGAIPILNVTALTHMFGVYFKFIEVVEYGVIFNICRSVILQSSQKSLFRIMRSLLKLDNFNLIRS